MQFPVTDLEYATYSDHLKEIKIIYQCYNKNQIDRLGFLDEHFVKLETTNPTLQNYNSIFERLTETEIQHLETRVNYINQIHNRIKVAGMKDRKFGDHASLVAKTYNDLFNVIIRYNALIAEKTALVISPPGAEHAKLNLIFNNMTAVQASSEEASRRYDITKALYQDKLVRPENENNCKTRVIEIVYDAERRKVIQGEIYQREYALLQSKGYSPLEADELAAKYSEIGEVLTTKYLKVIREAIHTEPADQAEFNYGYEKVVWNWELEGATGVAILPVVEVDGIQMIAVEIHDRYATGRSIEIPRGRSFPGEKEMDVAARQLKTEMGLKGVLTRLLEINPDSGILSSAVPIYFAQVTESFKEEYEKTEGIKGKIFLTVPELMECIIRGYYENKVDDLVIEKIPIRDPFLFSGLLAAWYKGLLKI